MQYTKSNIDNSMFEDCMYPDDNDFKPDGKVSCIIYDTDEEEYDVDQYVAKKLPLLGKFLLQLWI